MKRIILSCAVLALTLTACASRAQTTLTQAEVSPIPQQSPAATIFHYLAVRSGQPIPKDPVPVADETTIRSLVAAAQSGDRAKYNKLAQSSKVMLLPGGSIVGILGQKEGLVQVDLMSRDINDKDVSMQTGWISTQFLQEMSLPQ